jgi:hypothetical protein
VTVWLAFLVSCMREPLLIKKPPAPPLKDRRKVTRRCPEEDSKGPNPLKSAIAQSVEHIIRNNWLGCQPKL